MVVRRRSALGVEPSALRVVDASDIGPHPFTPQPFLSLLFCVCMLKLILLILLINAWHFAPRIGFFPHNVFLQLIHLRKVLKLASLEAMLVLNYDRPSHRGKV